MSSDEVPAARAFVGATVITLDAQRRVLRDGSVVVSGGTILAVGPTREVLRGLPDSIEIVPCSDRVICPGFVDVHAHLGEHLVRGLVPDGEAPQAWLPRWLLPVYSALRPEEEGLAAELAIAEMLLSGTTAFCEAGTLLEWGPVAEAVQRTGIRAVLGRWTWDLPEAPARMAGTADQGLRRLASMLEGVRALGLSRLDAGVILLGMGTASLALLKGAAELARDQRALLAMMHASVALQHGGRHVSHETLDRAGWLGPSTKLAHAVYVSEPELDRLVERDVRIAHCPSAALRHAKGISRHGRVPEMLQAGLTVGLGGDSANGSNHFDMLRLMYLAATLYKDFRMDTRLLPPETALEMATLHGARCLGQERRIGSLETGKRADLVIFDTRDPEWRPLLDPVQNLVLSASSRSVDSVWVEGRQVVKEGRLLTIDLPRLLERVQRASSAVLERVELAPQPPWPIL